MSIFNKICMLQVCLIGDEKEYNHYHIIIHILKLNLCFPQLCHFFGNQNIDNDFTWLLRKVAMII